MNNQEIYNKLGDLGTIMFVAHEMVHADDDVHEEEYNELLKIFGFFVSEENRNIEHFKATLNNVFEIYEHFEDFDAKLSYLHNSLNFFKDHFSDHVKQNILLAIHAMGEADGKWHANELALYGICSHYLSSDTADK